MPTLNPRLSSHLGEQGKKHVEQARLKALGLSALEGLGAAFLAWGLLAPEEEGVAWLVDVGFVLVVMAPVVLWVAFTFDGAVTPVAGFLVGCLLGTGVYFGIRTASLEPRWGVDPGGSTELQVLGAWAADGAVVRVRGDGAASYTLGEGRFLWTYAPPAGRTVCAMSQDGAGGVGLLAHAEPGGACDRVSAVDLATGEELWRDRVALSTVERDSPFFNVLTADARLAVLPERAGLRALDARSGEVRWTSSAPEGCIFHPWATSVLLSGGRLAVTYLCEEGHGRVESLRPETGRVLWSADWKEDRPVEMFELYGTDPVVVNAKEAGEDGAWRLFVFERGRRTAEIPASGRSGVVLPTYDKLPLLPGRGVQVHDGVVYTRVYFQDGLRESLVAYDRSGRRLWRTPPKDVGITAFSVRRNEILLLDGVGGDDGRTLTGIRVLDPADGEEREDVALSLTMKRPGVWLLPDPGGPVLAVGDGEYSLLAYADPS